MKHNTFMELFNQLAPELPSAYTQCWDRHQTILLTFTISEQIGSIYNTISESPFCVARWDGGEKMMSPSFPGRKEGGAVGGAVGGVKSGAAAQAQPYLAGEDPARLEQDKRHIYKWVHCR